ncbi:MAG TPA: SAM-dependent methyltransferase [Burkholderiaceae bacterium]|nr:SAM-dependent methyltransferase [Burkholderiaceae bacterium]
MNITNAHASLPPPSAEAADHSDRVRRHIADRIDAAGGWIGFDRYMDLALYAPGLGYYTAGARKIGDSLAGGDFVTAPEISPLFGRALARQVAEVLAQVTHGAPGRILEFGAGTGRLARDLLEALAACNVVIDRYEIVEVSADLRERQRGMLARWPVAWLDAPPRDFEGVIIANEVLDVMPVRLFIKGDAGLLERGVAADAGAFHFSDRPADAELVDAAREIETERAPFEAGYASEIGFVARAWSEGLAGILARGAALLIDYGFPRREYYHPQRRMGTIMCHYRHHSHADPFWLPGLNDITAHVDWTAVAQAAHESGLDVLGYTAQSRFLLNGGVLDLLANDHTPAQSSAVQRLLSEAEMGELFKVLAVGRGVSAPLVGFARGDRLHTL